MKFDLSGKIAVVSGGSSGIGKAIAETLKKQGAEVFIIDLNENPSNKKLGIHTFIADITQANKLNIALSSIPSNIDILINNAGIGFVGNIEQTEEKDFERLYQVNVKGVFNCIKAILPRMKKKWRGYCKYGFHRFSCCCKRPVGIHHDQGCSFSHDPFTRKRLSC